MARREPHSSPERIGGRFLPRAFLAVAVLLAGLVIYAGFIEPFRVTLERIDLSFSGLPAGLDGLKILQVSDLESHGRGLREDQVARLGREASADLVLITGDLVAKTLRGRARADATRAVAELLGALPSRYGVWMVEGHGERIDSKGRRALLEEMAAHGVRYLEDQVASLQINGSTLALAGLRVHTIRLGPAYTVARDGRILQDGTSSPGAYLNLSMRGSLPAAGYDFRGEFRFSHEASGIGVTFSNRMPDLEDRFYRMRRTEFGGAVKLSPHGTALSRGTTASRGKLSPGPWYAYHVRVTESEGAARVQARVWPNDIEEPESWSIDCVNEFPDRPSGGTVGLWASGPGRKEFRSLALTTLEGERILSGGTWPGGEPAVWEPPVAPDFFLHVEEQIPPGAFVVAMAHSPDAFPAAAALSWPLLLAGHTQGGQVRLPFIGALSTDTALGRKFSAGLYERGDTLLYITRGVGMSRVPLRFLSPPEVSLLTLHAGPARSGGAP